METIEAEKTASVVQSDPDDIPDKDKRVFWDNFPCGFQVYAEIARRKVCPPKEGKRH